MSLSERFSRLQIAPVAVAGGSKVSYSRSLTSRRVVHSELVGAITIPSTVNFQLLGDTASEPGYDLNPTNQKLFRWLSTIAAGYEKFRFNRCSFELKTSAPTSYPGRVYMAFDYDFEDNVPTSLSQISSTYGLSSQSVWCGSHQLNLNISMLNSGIPVRYVAHPTLTNGREPRTVYGGFLILAAAGCSSGGQLELWVHYDVDLMIPQDPVGVLSALSLPVGVNLPVVGSYPLPVDASSSIPRAVCGQTAPPMSSGGKSYTSVFDIGAMQEGLLVNTVTSATTSMTPAELCVGTSLIGNIYDKNGVEIGTLANGAVSAQNPNGTFSAMSASQWASAGAPMASTMGVDLKLLRAVYPLAKYLGFLIYNNPAKADAGAAFGSFARLLV